MRAKIVKIGNSQGIRIPKPLLEQTGIHSDVQLDVDDDKIIIRPVSNPREGWDKEFQKMSEQGDDRLVFGKEFLENEWDEEEWQW